MQQQRLNDGLMYTDEDRCIGCNNCIRKCPTLESNVGVMGTDGVCKMHLDAAECILCGTCLDTCTHQARRFRDDHDDFITGLKEGKSISVIIAPALLINYASEYKHILGYLKSLGVKNFYSVSFGADITTWAYLKYITENNAVGKFSQPCPAIVSYAERHLPELLSEIIPVQSPMMCMAIYLKKYMNVTDELAFLSPCIAKKVEMQSTRGLGMIRYNVTFVNLVQSLRRQRINLRSYPEIDDQISYTLGSIYPAPGGLRENVEFFLGEDAMVVQAEGESHAYECMEHYRALKSDWLRLSQMPTLVDILNCGRGCNYGTATEFRHEDNGAIQVEIHRLKRAKRKVFREISGNIDEGHSPEKNLAALNEKFKDLHLNDFLCKYDDRTTHRASISRHALDNAYAEMRKSTEDEKRFDCGACGYKSCKAMARAMAMGINYKENCAEYLKVINKEQTDYQLSVIEHFKEVDDVIHNLNEDNITISKDATNINERVEEAVKSSTKMQTNLNSLQEDFQKINASYAEISNVARTSNILSINASIEAAHAGAMGRGFSVIAEDMRNLAQKILRVAVENESNSSSIAKSLGDVVESSSTITSGIDGIKETTGEIRGNVDKISDRTKNVLDILSKLEQESDSH
ncbi:MAG: methyl-accepting chemotaxis protein [Defluviitaleaceae bacterium]|nr:methyl-accepting chemotaxis protein [Defluviitaleaceae bacterium]MCL2274769.1 methyl-accepting chemotaxis protein [Defluviitaleaceae bacterium]